jgi:hypothetical protein
MKQDEDPNIFQVIGPLCSLLDLSSLCEATFSRGRMGIRTTLDGQIREDLRSLSSLLPFANPATLSLPTPSHTSN